MERGRPGSELEKIIPKFFKRNGCGCKPYARKMNQWGVDGCEKRFEEIVDHLVSQSKNIRVMKHFGIVTRVVASRWLSQAIDNAKRIKQPNERFSVVWVYWAAGAESEELKYSMRSAQENLIDAGNFVLCGDIPKWFSGDAILSKKWTRRQNKKKFGTRHWAKWIDSIVKLKKIINDDRVTQKFLWMYDDTFIVKPTRIADMLEPRASGRIRASEKGNLWRKARARTGKALADANLPNWDYSTHCPIVYDKERLRETIEKFGCDRNPRVIESLYCNQWHSNPRGCSGFFHYRKRPVGAWNVPEWAHIVNVGGFNKRVRDVIKPMFPEPCEAESVVVS